MTRRTLARTLTITVLLIAWAPSGWAQEREAVNEDVVKILREHGLDKSEVMDTLSWLCDVHGPRLTGSRNLKRASEWAVKRLSEWGLQNARLEPWGPFGRGWHLEKVSMHVVGENPWPVLAWPKAWSPSIEGPVEADVVCLSDKSREEVLAMDLQGKIVLIESKRDLAERFEGDARRHEAADLLAMADGTSRTERGERPQPRERGDVMRQGALLRLVVEKSPLAILDRGSKGDYGTIFVAGASLPSEEGTARNDRARVYAKDAKAAIPQFTISVEHYNRILRLLEKKLPVRMAIDLRTVFEDEDPMSYNVLAEIPGSDPVLKDEIVMFGAHLDSWHSGTGTTDNGCGSAVMLEAARLLRALCEATGRTPKRTLRIALWTGEEQGLLGSRAYATQHFGTAERGKPPTELKPDHERLSAYFNLDNGTGKVRGVYLQGNEAVAPIFRSWLRPFHDLGASTLTLNDTGGTDHLSFDALGLPGFQFIQDPVAYSPRTHHSNMDVVDHAIADDLKQAATIIASFVWHTSERAGKLPRKVSSASVPK